MTLRRLVYLLFIVTMFVPGAQGSALARAPPVARAVISGGVGVAEGALVSLAIMVARARFQDEYVEFPSDIGWGWRACSPVVFIAITTAPAPSERDSS